ncbi:hypothetical protein [Kingella oralis]
MERRRLVAKRCIQSGFADNKKMSASRRRSIRCRFFKSFRLPIAA